MRKELEDGKHFYLDNSIMSYVDSLVYNLGKDWDFILLVTGDRKVRVGKSVLAMNLAACLNYKINKFYGINNKFTLDNIFWDSETMITVAEKLPKHNVIIYDEARESLASTKSMQKMQEDILDFFNECGQLNHIFILVLPDFFMLKEEIAVARSEFLINVYRDKEDRMVDMYKTGTKHLVTRFVRGCFDYYSSEDKSKLYDIYKCTRKKNYFAAEPTNRGKFTNNYPIDEEQYKLRKRDALSRRKEDKEKPKESRADVIRDAIILRLHNEGAKGNDISTYLEKNYEYTLSPSQVNRIIKNSKYE